MERKVSTQARDLEYDGIRRCRADRWNDNAYGYLNIIISDTDFFAYNP